ncbi:hypothetical protein EG68_09524 [Paragonimus skrjabini miyazakii]|uniref:Protein phosphatase inhibitor 2 n=1 Tax=Paragonimus skrjabini miyazakii TaxID=59628 RepID=A0A8S9Y9C8_9TREM|nr:hypothetical protein EG68_09524 [Paragonimus skrjabini miyazakii]
MTTMAEQPNKDGNVSPKSILKKPKKAEKQKSFQWDEMNILATYHPVDKTYGHMKIDEPKTPYVFETDDGHGSTYGATFTAEELAARLAVASHETDDGQLPRAARELEQLDPLELEHQRQFREKRKQHYNEFLAAKMARERLTAEDESSDDAELERAAAEALENARINAAMSRMPVSPGSSANQQSDIRNRSRSPHSPARDPRAGKSR